MGADAVVAGQLNVQAVAAVDTQVTIKSNPLKRSRLTFESSATPADLYSIGREDTDTALSFYDAAGNTAASFGPLGGNFSFSGQNLLFGDHVVGDSTYVNPFRQDNTSGTGFVLSDIASDQGWALVMNPDATNNFVINNSIGTPAMTILQTNNDVQFTGTVNNVGTGVGDLAVGAGGTMNRLPIGLAGQILLSNGTSPIWQTIPAFPQFYFYGGNGDSLVGGFALANGISSSVYEATPSADTNQQIIVSGNIDTFSYSTATGDTTDVYQIYVNGALVANPAGNGTNGLDNGLGIAVFAGDLVSVGWNGTGTPPGNSIFAIQVSLS
jgi:hypothetical protein